MPPSPYPTASQPHSNPFHHGHFSPPVHPISSYRTPSHIPSLRQPSLGYSPYPSDVSAASAESPLSSSSANESPLPEPPIENMDNDLAAHVASSNDDYYPYTTSEDVSLGYSYGHIDARPLPLPAYTLDGPEFYKQPVSAPLPLNLSLTMGYSWSPEAKKFQPLYPPIQHVQRPEHSPPKYATQAPHPAPAHTLTRATSRSAQPFEHEHEVGEPDLVYPQPPPRHYASAQQFAPGYSLRQGIRIKQENDVPFPDVYTQSADIASPSSGFGTFRTILESGSLIVPPRFPVNTDHPTHRSPLRRLVGPRSRSTVRSIAGQSAPLDESACPVRACPPTFCVLWDPTRQ